MVLTLFPSVPLRNKEGKITSDREGQGLNQARFIHFVVCLQQVHKLFSKPVLQKVRSTNSSFNFRYPLALLRSSSLRFLPRLHVAFTLSPIFPSITCFRRQFLHKKSLIHIAIILFIAFVIFLSSVTLSNAISHKIGPTDLLHTCSSTTYNFSNKTNNRLIYIALTMTQAKHRC